MRAEGAPPSRAFATACWVLVATGLVLQAAGVLQRGVHGDEFEPMAAVRLYSDGIDINAVRFANCSPSPRRSRG